MYLGCAGVVVLVDLDLEHIGSLLVPVQARGGVVTTGHLGHNRDMKIKSSSEKVKESLSGHWAEM